MSSEEGQIRNYKTLSAQLQQEIKWDNKSMQA